MSRLFRVFADSESPSSSCNSLNYRHTGPCLPLTIKPVVVAGCQYGVVSTDLGVRGASRLLLWAIPLGHSRNCEFELDSRTSSGVIAPCSVKSWLVRLLEYLADPSYSAAKEYSSVSTQKLCVCCARCMSEKCCWSTFRQNEAIPLGHS